MAVGLNQHAPAYIEVPIQQQEAPVQREEPGYLQRIGNGIVRVWNVVWEKGALAAQIVTGLFFRCVGWISPTLADKLEALWGHVTAIYLRIRAALREEELLGEIQGLRDHNRVLDVRVQELVDQSDIFRFANERLIWEKNQVTEERDRVIGERQELILNQAPILVERDHLREEKQHLIQERDEVKNQNEQVIQERNQAVAAKGVLEGEHHRALEDLGVLRLQLERAGNYQELNQHLAQFHELYLQIAQNGEKGATQMALETLIPQYKAHRGKLHEMLQIAIDSLLENDLGRIPLKGILRLSQEEMEHVEKISQTLHLFGELRLPLAQYFHAPIIQAVEVV